MKDDWCSTNMYNSGGGHGLSGQWEWDEELKWKTTESSKGWPFGLFVDKKKCFSS